MINKMKWWRRLISLWLLSLMVCSLLPRHVVLAQESRQASDATSNAVSVANSGRHDALTPALATQGETSDHARNGQAMPFGPLATPGRGLSGTGSVEFVQGVDGLPDLIEVGDFFGDAQAAGDFNSDGYVDLAVGAPRETIDGATDAGAVIVLYANPASRIYLPSLAN